jgi:hypothetical protein
VALNPRVRLAAVVVLAAAIAVPLLVYLRDPPWLITTTSGFGRWQQEPGGPRFRWMGGHASFFVRSGARAIELPVRTTFAAGDWPVTVTVSIDDRPADRITLSDARWRSMLLRLPPAGSRRVRRIDIRLDRTRDEDHGVMVGEPHIE